jgi:hypothetical protein
MMLAESANADELIGVAVLVIIGAVLIALAPSKQLLESASHPNQLHSL